jgi:hypothetical protein
MLETALLSSFGKKKKEAKKKTERYCVSSSLGFLGGG